MSQCEIEFAQFNRFEVLFNQIHFTFSSLAISVTDKYVGKATKLFLMLVSTNDHPQLDL